MRYFAATLWVTVTLYLLTWSISDFAFGIGNARRLFMRVMLAFIWPFAILSRPGRKLMFKTGKGL